MKLPNLNLFLLGDFRLSLGNKRAEGINTLRLRSLIAYLALHHDAAPSRQHIAFLFWPDSEEGQARTNLRQLLHHLRQAFPDIENYLNINDKTLAWNQDAPLYLDVGEFERLFAEAEVAGKTNDLSREQEKLENAVRLYRADLFPECYDEWIEVERDRLRQRFAKALERLALILEQQGQFQKALGHTERLLALDKFNESTYRLLMKLYALTNDRASAMRTYNLCVEVLDEELGIEPSAETQESYNRLSRGAVEPKTRVLKETEIPLVGRESEWSVSMETWETSTLGKARLLLFSGEAGIGKTRLAQQLHNYIERQGFVAASARCYAAEGRLAYAPIAEWLKADAIHQSLPNLESVWQTEIARLLPELLVEDSNLAAPGPLAESWQLQRFFEALAHAIIACRQPLLLFVDDLQWCDSDTLEWLHYLLRFDPSAKILIVATVRLEALKENESLISLILELRRAGLLTEIELNALNAEQSAQLARHVSGQELDSEAAAALYEETEGSPLFVVEMTRANLEKSRYSSTDKTAPEFVLPERVQAVIQTRLSCLTPSALKLLELAAIIGRVFTFEVLAHASDCNDEVLIQSLDELCDRRLIRERQSAYDFSHDKIREVAAAGISAARGRLFHRHIAEALETVFAGQSDQVNGRLAAHYEHAGVPLRAISYYERAGKVAKAIFANEEAANYLNQALRLIRNHLQGHDQETRELEIQRVLSTCLVQGRGYGATEVQRTGVRALELCARLGEQPDPPLLRMLAISKLVVCKISQAEAFGLQLLEQAQALDDDVVRVEAHYALGVTYHWQGRFEKAREYLEKAITLYDSQHHQTHSTVYAQDPAVVCRIRLALVLWHLGHPNQSQNVGIEALELAEKLAHPFSRSYVLHWFAWLQNLRGDSDATLKHAKISIAFSEQYDFPYFATQSRILYGWALLQTGDIENGIQEMREGLSRFRATGSEIGCPYYRALIAEALAGNGQIAQSHRLLDEALQSVKDTGELWSESSILRIRGNVLAPGPSAQNNHAENSFKAAIKVAREQEAKGDALRAALHLKQFWLGLGRKDDAQKQFQDIYDWATLDLKTQEQKALKTTLEQWTQRHKF